MTELERHLSEANERLLAANERLVAQIEEMMKENAKDRENYIMKLEAIYRDISNIKQKSKKSEASKILQAQLNSLQAQLTRLESELNELSEMFKQ